jgi:hypothetical protein
MTATATTAVAPTVASDSDSDERRALLEQLWMFLAQHCLDYMRTIPPEERSTRHLSVIRAFLKDSGITAEQGRRLGDTGALSSLLSLGVPFGGPTGEGH